MLIDCPPIKDGEALNGYFLRLAERNGIDGIQQLLAPVSIKPRTSYTPEQLGRIATLLGTDWQVLSQANLVTSREARPDTNAHFVPGARLPVCPQCFAEEPIVRREWLNTMSPVCTRHGLRLVDHCPSCESPLTWRRMSLSMCDCGAPLVDAPVQEAPRFSMALSCALHGHDLPLALRALVPENFLAMGAPQRDELVWFLAAHSADPAGHKVAKRPRPGSAAEAIEFLERNLAPVLSNWPQGMHDLLHRIDGASNSQSAGVGKQLGTWYRGLHRNFGHDRFQWLHDEVAEYVAEHLVLTVNSRTSRIPAVFGEIKGWLSVAEAARVIGVAPDRLRQALRAGEVQGELRRAGPDRDYGFLRRGVVDQIRQQRGSYVEGRRAMAILDVTKRQLRRLVEVGAITEHAPSDRPALVDAPFLEEEIQGFLRQIESRHQPWPTRLHGPAILFADIAAVRGRGEDYVLRAYRAILRGDVVPREVRADEVGLSRLVFDQAELETVALPNVNDARMTLTQLCDMTGWKHESVAKWVSNEFLKAERVDNGATRTTLIRVDDLIHFLSRHVILAVMARECGTQSSDLIDLLESQGCEVHSFNYESRRGKFGSIVAFEDLGAVLQEVCRPTRFRG